MSALREFAIVYGIECPEDPREPSRERELADADALSAHAVDVAARTLGLEREAASLRELADAHDPEALRELVVGVHGAIGVGPTWWAFMDAVHASLPTRAPRERAGWAGQCAKDAAVPADAVRALLLSRTKSGVRS